MLFSNRKRSADADLGLFFDGRMVNFQDAGKFLGVHVDSGLIFDVHIPEISRKVSKSVGSLYRISHCVPENMLVNLYYSLVYPYLLYCNIIWGGTYAAHLNTLQLLQKKVVRIITGQPI